MRPFFYTKVVQVAGMVIGNVMVFLEICLLYKPLYL